MNDLWIDLGKVPHFTNDLAKNVEHLQRYIEKGILILDVTNEIR